MNNLQIFNSPDFGQIRTIQQNGEPWFVGKREGEIMEERLPLELWRKIYNQRECKANKQLICDKLCAVLQLTNRFYDLESLEYVEENEYESHVYAKFTHGSGIVVTSMDNSWGMIVDIIKQLPGA